MRISISVVSTNVDLTTDLIPLDVFPDMSLNDMKALIEGEIGVPALSQHFFYDNRSITDNSQTLEQLNIQEGDMLGMSVRDPEDHARRRNRRPESDITTPRAQRPREGPDPERMRLHIVGDPRMLAQVRAQDPELADASSNRDRFHAVWDQRQRQVAQAEAEKNAQLAMLNADPFNPETQRRIEDLIRQERVAENVQKALEENPESFGRVVMLYIHVLVNNTPIKAFVDSGAQTTIMSPEAAERCGIMRLVDTRFGGIAKGVGTAKILGRVHSAEIQIGQYALPSSFTVMEGKDVDLLLGLDMLKRHQMCIDLRGNCLIIQNDKISFLPENEIPKMFDEILENEPKIEGPEGTKVGARTGTVEQQQPAASASEDGKAPSNNTGSTTSTPKINIHPAGSQKNIHTSPSAFSPSASSAAASQQPTSSTFGFGQPQRITPESIAKITDLGFTRDEAIHALQQVGGDVELAVGLLL